MAIEVTESVGLEFKVDQLERARDLTLKVIEEVAARVTPGLSEKELKEITAQVQEAHGAPKSWHPPQIRVGENTLLPFGRKGLDNPIIQKNDIYFIDIGPIFDGHEGDVGRAFSVGDDLEMQKCARDAETLWKLVRDHWSATSVSGAELYHFAKQRAEEMGWLLNLDKANGHRISDFPHAAKFRGSIEGWPEKPSENRWILEIQIRHPNRAFGAFYEDLLN